MSLFKQFLDKESFTYTYFIAEESSKESIIIDPVLEHVEAYLEHIEKYGYKLSHVLETHVHADHITGGSVLRERTGAKTSVSELCGTSCADQQLKDGDIIQFGSEELKVISTPGHTIGSVCFLWRDRLFTGDSLLIGGCGRTDFQKGDPSMLYGSVTKKIFKLADETLIYPGHDYNGKCVSCVAQERGTNPRFAGKSKKEFVEIMNNLKLPDPKMMDVAVTANQQCGNLNA